MCSKEDDKVEPPHSVCTISYRAESIGVCRERATKRTTRMCGKYPLACVYMCVCVRVLFTLSLYFKDKRNRPHCVPKLAIYRRESSQWQHIDLLSIQGLLEGRCCVIRSSLYTKPHAETSSLCYWLWTLHIHRMYYMCLLHQLCAEKGFVRVCLYFSKVSKSILSLYIAKNFFIIWICYTL